ncbi:class I SAM-dependent RNA methyltransferase [[Mycoplasma] mobile]|uniref:Uncharacterized RNA methyltransferase MMOB5020 n=1 Tax=Mycoplasma mobile (strain ATCC 43663 / 163K / NCTC 11711) TaxID=267748 RepID=Y5020_MYCM1|nr:methyltransferase domain-containing protein [[Mycoplasma] mobile]Q6KHE2.1 RecName: Full=Uncharacterized RNA methyltransferase MMOB5020 [Mycoplasma mobile 163K]AAT27988.1 SAM-dependent methyltransferases [Mycoplasma mobile 163K]
MIAELEIIFYSQKGEGVGFYLNKPTYVKGVIKGEKIKAFIYLESASFFKARLVEILIESKNRNHDVPKLHYLIGGYELLHMNNTEQINFKKERVINDFKKIANYEISSLELVQGKKLLHYRNKITLHYGSLYLANSNHKIKLAKSLLTDINLKANKKEAEWIIRKLDTQIEGTKQTKIYTTDKMNGITFRVGLNSFYQVNKEVANLIYNQISEFINLNENVLDLYSGIGTISLLIAAKAKSVTGVERNLDSIEDANFNKEFNKIKNVNFIHQDVIKYLKQNKTYFDTVIVDPARRGLEEDIIELILKLKPQKIIYLSCNVGTQASNFNKFKHEYQIEFIKSYDMFPQTYHIESLMVLKKLNKQ